ncbi:hypothetical protein SLURMMXVI_10053 [Escherichia phage vB_Eco_SLUR63]|nr:hypothetical protein [Escherichia phage Skure]QXV79582.1 hypothetical protein bas21_0070 [Escherichia phage GottfriedDienst]SOE45258.1 hypothetical protein SLURMMXVI_140030 [Escherichia phage vB_Eco_SLUR25]VAY27844.1 hypothetical protein SLURMMXVI_10053 [Escherichia phage vB_Eco_SLUR63]HBC8488049.1 hypothetical protein [Escherichia coli]
MDCQKEFDLKYITTSEIENRFGLSRRKLCSLRGKLPGEVKIANVYVYVRAVAEPVLMLHAGRVVPEVGRGS